MAIVLVILIVIMFTIVIIIIVRYEKIRGTSSSNTEVNKNLPPMQTNKYNYLQVPSTNNKVFLGTTGTEIYIARGQLFGSRTTDEIRPNRP